MDSILQSRAKGKNHIFQIIVLHHAKHRAFALHTRPSLIQTAAVKHVPLF